MTIDEKARRRSCFDVVNSVAIVLADEQQWFLPKPWLEIRPAFHSGRSKSARSIFTYGNELDNLISDVGRCSDDAAIIAAISSLGAQLLLGNYDLTDAELQRVFQFRLGDERSLDWAKQVMDVATGQSGPKVFSGGAG